ncbi:unnamed protein product [Cercospora beticola]|nr:unnamed protein product [Cercospora beticola]
MVDPVDQQAHESYSTDTLHASGRWDVEITPATDGIDYSFLTLSYTLGPIFPVCHRVRCNRFRASLLRNPATVPSVPMFVPFVNSYGDIAKTGRRKNVNILRKKQPPNTTTPSLRKIMTIEEHKRKASAGACEFRRVVL